MPHRPNETSPKSCSQHDSPLVKRKPAAAALFAVLLLLLLLWLQCASHGLCMLLLDVQLLQLLWALWDLLSAPVLAAAAVLLHCAAVAVGPIMLLLKMFNALRHVITNAP